MERFYPGLEPRLTSAPTECILPVLIIYKTRVTMGKGKIILAGLTVVFGAIMSIAPPLAAWYTRKKEAEKEKADGKT